MSVKTSINIPEDLFKAARKLSDNFSAVVAEELKEYLRKKKVEKAVASFGKWAKRGENSAGIVKELRKEDRR